MSTRVLMISPQAFGSSMGRTAIRFWHLAHALGAELEVTLMAPGPMDMTSNRVRLAGYDRTTGLELYAAASQADVLVLSGPLLTRYPNLRDLPQPLVMDLFDPVLLEEIEANTSLEMAEQQRLHRASLEATMALLLRGDYFLCATEWQRDYWVGLLTAAGRVSPKTLEKDPTLRGLIDVVGFGLDDAPPAAERRALKGVYPGIAADDRVIYWGGGIWAWSDTSSAIRAMSEIVKVRPEVKLFFASVNPPHAGGTQPRMAEMARALASGLGLAGKNVIFNDWVPISDRVNYLLDADVGLSLYFEHLEVRYAYRVRLLDYIWTGLPMVVTRGDVFSDSVVQAGLARAVAPQDYKAVVRSVLEVLDYPGGRAAFAPRARALAETLRWSRQAQPLLQFCRAPAPAADRPLQAAARPGLFGKALDAFRKR